MDAFDAMASRMYPSMVQAPQEPAKAATTAPDPAPPAKVAAAEPVSAEDAMAERIYGRKPAAEEASLKTPSTEPREPLPPEEETLEQRLYGDAVSTNSSVDWAEEAAPDVAQYKLEEMPIEFRDPDPAAYAAGQAQFREALLAAGAGPTLARELWTDAMRAERNRITTTVADASAQLRERWGPKADAKVAAAHALMSKAIAKCPEIKTWLERTGLGNDVNFIVKLSKRADALAKKGR
jgi:hypothetical protein